MQTVFHEIGHALLEGYTQGEEHNMRNVYLDESGHPHRTPLGHGGTAGNNYCGDDVDYHTTERQAIFFDDCATDHFSHTD